MIYLGLGSNVGHRSGHLRRAIQLIRGVMNISAVSSIYSTPPWGVVDQPDFLNLCLVGESTLSATDLLPKLKAIEQQMGRRETRRWGERLIDIDILFDDDHIIETEVKGYPLTIPHPYITERDFVLAPLSEIAPNFVHPTLHQTISTLYNQIQDHAQPVHQYTPLKTREITFSWLDRTYVMGIINVTPDSFSGDGIDAATHIAVQKASDFLADGADILDIGGESTRPNGDPVTAAIEQARVLPIITALRREFPHTPLSIDTYRAETAQLALEAGVDWVNDVWGMQYDDAKMASVVAKAGCPVVIMHNGRGRPRLEKEDGAGGYYGYFHYDDLINEVKAELEDAVKIALDAGVHHEQIILDPGIGFGKSGDQNLLLINRLDELQTMSYPILLGASRKGFIGHLLGGLSADQRVEGTIATTVLGINKGANIVRVHDVKENVRACQITDAICRSS